MSPSSSVITRIAPSPTGLLHIGNVRRALDNWLFAKSHGGLFMLRSDDTDLERSTKEFESQIMKDLEWLGLTWDIFVRQSERAEHYHHAATLLKEQGRLYPCFETPQELDFKRKQALAAGRPPIYDRAALDLSPTQISQFVSEGRPHHWRFQLTPGEITWNDLVHGSMSFQSNNLSDPILIRSDGVVLYTLASVVDDLEFQISHIIRGDDHITNTAIQIQLMEALHKNPPPIQFAHLPLLTAASGEGLSKREGSMGVETLREEGIEPITVLSYLANLGSRDPIEPTWALSTLIHRFDLAKFSKATPKFQLEDIRLLNEKTLHEMPYPMAHERLEQSGLPLVSEELWTLIRDNLHTLDDVAYWNTVCHGKLSPPETLKADKEFFKAAIECFPKTPLTESSWKEWTDELKLSTGRKGKELFSPLRQALTGQATGPEMKQLFRLISPQSSLERLEQCL